MTVIKVIAVIALAVGIYFLCRGILFLVSRKGSRLSRSQWQQYLTKRNLGRKCLLAVPGIVLYFLLYGIFERGSAALIWFHKADIIYLICVFLIIANSILLTFLDLYSHTDKNKTHPLKGLIQGLQVILYFVAGIIIIAILLDKSPTVLLTGLGASAAVLMLIFPMICWGRVTGCVPDGAGAVVGFGRRESSTLLWLTFLPIKKPQINPTNKKVSNSSTVMPCFFMKCHHLLC